MRIPFAKAAAALGVELAFSAQALEKFVSEAQAQQHCPKDVVVCPRIATCRDTITEDCS